ncbi:TetR/AcrR family transcriptional regulator [Lichenibacterium ramalinae]|uniref:TetR/AcrR family transcriptional regulator n=1 Tax=Lichenibacterium ramalinae TaxID=2316527 RepID=A0A4Q2R905_9HYPH|nr:TetR/AcrR family transcriptional regulator [Lichenibacterium ramalinae]RYB03265.1 TetR/AcrR family transcriptional regulator [Lichenibacterium ramalinae]
MTDAPPPAGPGRRRRGPSPAKTAATRRALVEAGLALFLDTGYGATRMSDVALRAGLGKGTIYLHFSDKAALFDAVVREVALRTRAQRALPRPRPNEPTRDFLRRVVPPLLGLFRDSGLSRVILLVASEGARLPEVADVYRQVIIDPVLRIVVLYAGRAERRGELRAGPLSRHPLIMVAPVVVTTLYNTLFAGAAPVDVLATFDDFLDLLFAAGAKSPA